MMDTDMTGSVQTVLGPVSPGDLGVTLTHEHLLIDLGFFRQPPPEASLRTRFAEPVSLSLLGLLKQTGAVNVDNGRLLDLETAIGEAALYRRHGGGSLVDATSVGIARDPGGLAQIARATGVNIVMGSSYYVAGAHPADMDSRTEDDIFAEIVRDVTVGVEATGIRAGVIGEVGCSWPMTANERRVLRASGRAQVATGSPLLVHPGRDETAPMQAMEVLAGVGADPTRIIMSHIDRTVFLRSTLQQLAQTGCYLEWDLFGREQSYYAANRAIDMPTDAQRMDDIAWISDLGYGDRVVVAHDVCSKDRMAVYGGHGYHYVLSDIAPRMRERGFTQGAIEAILVGNPAAALTFAAPADPSPPLAKGG